MIEANTEREKKRLALCEGIGMSAGGTTIKLLTAAIMLMVLVLIAESSAQDKFLEIHAVDESETPIPRVEVLVWTKEDTLDPVVTDEQGIITVPSSAGLWTARVNDPSYLYQNYNALVKSSSETEELTVTGYHTDTTIKGHVAGEIGSLGGPVVVKLATFYLSGQYFNNHAEVGPDGSFSINVSSVFTYYNVHIDEKGIPEDYTIVPDRFELVDLYPYTDIPPGTDTLKFALYELTSTISGRFNIEIPASGYYDVHYEINDPSTGFYVQNWFEDDGSYSVKVPNGTYTVIGGYWGDDDTLVFTRENLMVENADIGLDFNPGGIVSVHGRTGKMKGHQAFKPACAAHPYDGGPGFRFDAPEDGTARLQIIDMKGRTVREFFFPFLARGEHWLSLNGPGWEQALPSGGMTGRLMINGKITTNRTLTNIR